MWLRFLPCFGQERLAECPAVSAIVHWRAHIAALSTPAALRLSELQRAQPKPFQHQVGFPESVPRHVSLKNVWSKADGPFINAREWTRSLGAFHHPQPL